MDKKMIKIIIVLIIILIAVSVLFYKFAIIEKTTYTYDKTDQAFFNPMMGFAPSADSIEAVGDNTLVYIDITWKEWEPEEGIYDSEKIIEENYLDKWRDTGKKAVLRFICDLPGEEEHRDIPDWLYEKTADGNDYDCSYGKGYSPNYKNPVFIEAHAKAIEALGAKFGQDSFVCYVELGSLGHWGEWHVKYDEGIARFPSENICVQYVKPYIAAFPNAKLLMRRPYESVTNYKLGVFNDMTGDEEATTEWLGWIERGGSYEGAESPLKLIAYPDIWKESPVGGEFTSSLSMSELLVTKIDHTVELLRNSHMTFIGPKCPIANQEALQYPEGTNTVLKNIGYRYGIRSCTVIENAWLGKITLELVMENSGTAPMYFDWPVYVYIMDENKKVIEKKQVPVKLSELYEDQAKTISVSLYNKNYEDKPYTVGIGIEDPDTMNPEVTLDMACESYGKIATLFNALFF